MKRVIKLIFLLWSVVFTACGGSGLPPFDDSDGASGPPSAASSPTMYLKLIDSTKYEYMQYQVLPTFDFTKICEVSKTAVTNEDLSCVFDVNEMDLYFWGGTLEFVVPPEICHYVQFSHYWHYNYEVGFGPSAITM